MTSDEYGEQLDQIAELLGKHHPIGQVKAFGRMECLEALRQLLEPPVSTQVPIFSPEVVASVTEALDAAVEREWSPLQPGEAELCDCPNGKLLAPTALEAELATLRAQLAAKERECEELRRSLLSHGKVVTQCPQCSGVGGCHSSCAYGGYAHG